MEANWFLKKLHVCYGESNSALKLYAEWEKQIPIFSLGIEKKLFTQGQLKKQNKNIFEMSYVLPKESLSVVR